MNRAFLPLSVALGLCLLPGGQARAEKPDDPTAVTNDLKEILLAYHTYLDKNKGSAPAKAADTAASRSSLTCRVGDGTGRLVVQSHNGNVVFR